MAADPAHQEGLGTSAYHKAVAHTEDVTFIISKAALSHIPQHFLKHKNSAKHDPLHSPPR